MSFILFGAPISMSVDDFVGILVALALAIYLIYSLVRPGKL